MSLDVPKPSYKSGRESTNSVRLSQLLANTLMVGQYMEYKDEKDGLIQVPFDQRQATTEEKIDVRINLLNKQLEEELNKFRLSDPPKKEDDGKADDGHNSWTKQIRNSLFPRSSLQSNQFRDLEKKSRRKFNLKCLILMVVTVILLVLFLTVTLVFTINKAYPDSKQTSSLVDGTSLEHVEGILPPTDNCQKVLKCFNGGNLVMLNGNCTCLCPKDLMGIDCRTLIKPAK